MKPIEYSNQVIYKDQDGNRIESKLDMDKTTTALVANTDGATAEKITIKMANTSTGKASVTFKNTNDDKTGNPTWAQLNGGWTTTGTFKADADKIVEITINMSSMNTTYAVDDTKTKTAVNLDAADKSYNGANSGTIKVEAQRNQAKEGTNVLLTATLGTAPTTGVEVVLTNGIKFTFDVSDTTATYTIRSIDKDYELEISSIKDLTAPVATDVKAVFVDEDGDGKMTKGDTVRLTFKNAVDEAPVLTTGTTVAVGDGVLSNGNKTAEYKITTVNTSADSLKIAANGLVVNGVSNATNITISTPATGDIVAGGDKDLTVA